jgi:hypothetical protein
VRSIDLVPDRRGHVSRLLGDLIATGWTIEGVPTDGRIPRNGVLLSLLSGDIEIRLRVFLYKVTSSGRSRPHERRVEITTTYQSGLSRSRRFRDIVLGVDMNTGKYVGIDSRRLHLGGATHNASSFFDLEGLSAKQNDLVIIPRSVAHALFRSDVEFHAFFDRNRLAEYLANAQQIHRGTYQYDGMISRSSAAKRKRLPGKVSVSRVTDGLFVLSARLRVRTPKISRGLVTAVEERDFSRIRRAKLSPERLKAILAICDYIGALGEQTVLENERTRLRRLGFGAVASQVERVSLFSVGEGYDILSFEDDGKTRRYIEVKTTIGRGSIVDISSGEWNAAKKYRQSYYLVRVTDAKANPKLHYIRDPVALEQNGLIAKTATGWRIDISKVV